jgi:hypothetical protein
MDSGTTPEANGAHQNGVHDDGDGAHDGPNGTGLPSLPDGDDAGP